MNEATERSVWGVVWGPLMAAAVALVVGCTSGSGGAPCDGGACEAPDAGTITEDAGPPAPSSCAELVGTDACPANRACDEGADGPMCLFGCEDGFRLQRDGTCARCVLADCSPPPSCEPTDAGSIVAACESERRVCDELGDIDACGGCQPGFRENTDGVCVVEVVCGGVVCAEDEMAQDLVGQPGECECVPIPCDPGFAEDVSANDAGCVDCRSVCSGAHVVGTHPITDATGGCVCDTEPGFFWPQGLSAQAQACDADGDTWISETAFQTISLSDGSPQQEIAEANCLLRTVDRVALVNEYGQQLTLFLCADGPSMEPCEEALRRPLSLVEADRNDDDTLLAQAAALPDTPVPAYGSGGTGALPSAAALNPLTKGCVDVLADYDANGEADIAQAQPLALGAAATWSHFSYFMELHTSEYVSTGSLGEPGALVIRERSRCGQALDEFGTPWPSVALGYGDDQLDGGYWRQCARQPDTRFDPAATEPAPGFDFAQFQDGVTEGARTIPPTPPLDGSDAAIPHGVCQHGPWERSTTVWRGFGHHSQFKCVQVGGSHAFSREESRFTATGDLDFQRCADDDGDLEAIDCTVDASPEVGSVGWAAVTYQGSEPAFGCIDEGALWGDLCPLRDASEGGGRMEATTNDADFGQLVCGCDGAESRYFEDDDGDGHGDPATSVVACAPPVGATGHVWVASSDDCDPDDGTVFPGASDAPDDAFVDSNCDGVDGTATALLFVAPNGNDSVGDGSRGAPFATISHAIAVADPSLHDIAVGEGVYRERVVVVPGVSVYGGYVRVGDTDEWVRSDLADVVIEQLPSDMVGTGATRRVEALVVSGVHVRTVLDRLEVVAGGVVPPGATGASVYGIRVVDSDASAVGGVEIRNTTVVAGVAANGSAGSDGADGQDGANGGGASGRTRGGGGAARSCPGGDGARTRGGAGGDGGTDPIAIACTAQGLRDNGDSGSRPPGDSTCAVGAGGGSAFSCTHGHAVTGGSGHTCGSASATGPAASGIIRRGHVDASGLWIAEAGNADGGYGQSGMGASGGGGGGAGDCDTVCTGGHGGGGGGGGGGGCGGSPGVSAGGGGGGSFGLLVAGSDGVIVVNSTFSSGRAGAGGAGGDGGEGGDGGARGGYANGGSTGGFLAIDVRGSRPGGQGGAGRSGAPGGGAGGGAGGPSVAQFICRSANIDVRNADGTPGAAGAAGSGGWPNGPDGPAGVSSQLLTVTGEDCQL